MANTTSRLTIAIDSKRAQANAESLATSLDKTTVAGTKASAAAKVTAASYRAVATAAAGYIGALSVGAITSDLQKLQSLNATLSTLTGDLAGNQKFLADTAKELSVDYVELGTGYAKLLSLYDAGVTTLATTRELTIGLANAASLSAQGMAGMSNSIVGLSQLLEDVNYENYRQVFEPIPGLNARVAASFDTTSAGLKEMISNGEIGAEVMGVKLLEALRSYDGAAASRADNIEQTFARTRNAYLEAIEAFETPITAAATGPAKAVAEAFELIADNADEIVTAVTVAGGAIALNFGASQIARMQAYFAAQGSIATSTYALISSEVKLAQTASLRATSELAVATATAKSAAAKLVAVNTTARYLAGEQQLAFVATQVAGAEKAAAIATAQLAAAQAAATGASTTLASAQAAVTRTSLAMGVASRAAAGALALVGGLPGVALIAAGGVYYLATRQSEAEKTAISLKEAMAGLNDAYAKNAAAASDAADATIESQQANLTALKRDLIAQKKALEDALGTSGGTSAGGSPALVILDAQIRKATDDLNAFTEANDRLKKEAQLDATAEAISAALKRINDAAKITAESVQEAYDDLFPDEKKIADLKASLKEFERALGADLIDDDKFAKISAEIDRQIADLDPLNKAREEAARKAEEYADRVKAALDLALPDEARSAEQVEQMKLLQDQYEKGGPAAEKFGRAIDALQQQFDEENADRNTEAVQRFIDVLERPVNDPFASYRTDIQLLNEALEALPNKAVEIGRAMSLLNLSIEADLTVIRSSENEAETKLFYAAQVNALIEWNRERQATQEQADASFLALARSTQEQLESIQTAANEKKFKELYDFQTKYQAAQPDAAGIALDIGFNDASLSALQITDAEERNKKLLALNETYQQRASEIVRAGEGTRAQIEAASQSDRFAAFVNSNEQTLQAVQGLANEITGLLSQAAQIDFEKASKAANADQSLLQKAEAAYKASATEKNRIALEAAQKQADISESYARREFENQKKYARAQAVVASFLTVAQAFAAPTLDPIAKFAIAAASALQVAAAIRGINASTYDGASGSAGSAAAPTQQLTANNQPQAQVQPAQTVVYVVSGNFRTEDEAIAEAARAQQKASERKWINYPNGTPDFRNVPKEVVRING